MVELNNIKLGFNGSLLFDGLSLKVPEGGSLIIKGDSGTGKTTILRLMLGLVRPQEGKVIIDGDVLDRNNIWTKRSVMAYVSQDLSLGQAKVFEFIEEVFTYRQNRHLYLDRKEATDLTALFGLSSSILEASLDDISGGELQRVAIITSLLLKRKIYLLDEITSALDDNLKEAVANHFFNLNATLVIVSHDSVWQGQDIPNIEL